MLSWFWFCLLFYYCWSLRSSSRRWPSAPTTPKALYPMHIRGRPTLPPVVFACLSLSLCHSANVPKPNGIGSRAESDVFLLFECNDIPTLNRRKTTDRVRVRSLMSYDLYPCKFMIQWHTHYIMHADRYTDSWWVHDWQRQTVHVWPLHVKV